MRSYHLPAPARPEEAGLAQRAHAFLSRSWRGRILLGALAVFGLGTLGLPVPGPLAGLAKALLWIYALWAGFRLARYLVRSLLWRIRTKLLVSYLFIAVVPIVLLVLLFGLAAWLLSGLVGSHMVSTEVSRISDTLQNGARVALVDLPPEGIEAAINRRLATARAVHPDVAFVYVRRGARIAGSARLPTTLPAWLEGPSFSGLVKPAEGAVDVVRGVWREADAFVLVEAPFDATLFADFEERTGARIVSFGGSVDVDERKSGIRIRIDPDRTRSADEANADFEGAVFLAAPERVDWTSGARDAEPLGFAYQPVELMRRLSPGALDMADLLVKALAAVSVVFLVVYVIALGLGFLLARSVTRSIHALSVGTEKLRQGQFGHVIRVRSRDQLGELAESFNMMARGIEDLLRQTAEKERLEEELRIARQIQMSLLPQGAITLPGLRIAALCLPAAEVGGDYYDLLPLSATRMGVLIADVSGKGTSAALYMAELKGLVLSLSRVYESPARLLVEANRILSANMDSRSFVTMTYAIVDVAARTMRYARAGHNPILHMEAATGRTRVLTPSGLGLGLDRGARFEELIEEAEAPLASGDAFLFFTDGLSEAMNGRSELFGEERLRDILEQGEALTSEELRERIMAEIRAFVGDADQHDDMTMVILKVL